jgi:hypothetical protein
MAEIPAIIIEPVRVEIARLRLEPGDVLVVRVQNLPIDPGPVVERFGNTLKQCCPEGVKVLIIDGNIDLSILTKSEIERRLITAA